MKAYSERFYAGPAWRKCRRSFLKAHPLCERCLKRGDVVPAKIAHHKIYITPENINDPESTLNWDNLQAVCQDCHNIIHGEKQETLSYRFGPDGQIIPVEEDKEDGEV